VFHNEGKQGDLPFFSLLFVLLSSPPLPSPSLQEEKPKGGERDERESLIILNERKSHFDVSISNGSVIAMMFKDLCGSYSEGKKVPNIIKTASKEIKEAFIAGYLAGDGCILHHPQNNLVTKRIRTVSNIASADIRELLINLGYTPNVREESNDHGYNKSGRIWTIEWRDRKNGDNGSCRSWNIENTIVSRIYDIEEEYQEYDTVYDLTVDEDHTYMVENITVSNCNEGFGLPTLEAMMCGKPIIALKTGGLTRQVEHPETGEQFGIGLDPEVRTMVGNHMVPYIYEDFVSHGTVTAAFMRMYEMGPEERERIGTRASVRAREDYNLERVVSQWDSSLESPIEKFRSGGTEKWKVTEI
jgi:glycosyltransferase involved in cell wall biosynthesis